MRERIIIIDEKQSDEVERLLNELKINYRFPANKSYLKETYSSKMNSEEFKENENKVKKTKNVKKLSLKKEEENIILFCNDRGFKDITDAVSHFGSGKKFRLAFNNYLKLANA